LNWVPSGAIAAERLRAGRGKLHEEADFEFSYAGRSLSFRESTFAIGPGELLDDDRLAAAAIDAPHGVKQKNLEIPQPLTGLNERPNHPQIPRTRQKEEADIASG